MNGSIFGKRGRKKYDEIFREWYGADGANAAAGHLLQPLDISEIMGNLEKKLVPPWERKFDRIANQWQEIVGELAVKKIRPLKIIENKVLLLELRHPAYRAIFDTVPMKKAILEKINSLSGEELCGEIRFVAAGMYAPMRKK